MSTVHAVRQRRLSNLQEINRKHTYFIGLCCEFTAYFAADLPTEGWMKNTCSKSNFVDILATVSWHVLRLWSEILNMGRSGQPMLFQTATSGGSCSRSGWCTGDRICPPPVTLSTCSCLSAAASARHSRSSAAPLAWFWSNSGNLLSHSPQCFFLLLHCTSVFYSFCFDNLPGAVQSSSRILFFVHHSIMLFEMAK